MSAQLSGRAGCKRLQVPTVATPSVQEHRDGTSVGVLSRSANVVLEQCGMGQEINLGVS